MFTKISVKYASSLWGVAAVAALSALHTPALSETPGALAVDIAALAASTQPLELGQNLALEGAQAEEGVLRYLVSAPNVPAEEARSVYDDLLAAACSDARITDLLQRGASVEYVIRTDQERQADTFSLSAASCGVIATATVPTPAEFGAAAGAGRFGLDATLERVATQEDSGVVLDDLDRHGTEASGGSLRVAVTVGAMAASDAFSAAHSADDLACGDVSDREALQAGAEIAYAIDSAAAGQPEHGVAGEEACAPSQK